VLWFAPGEEHSHGAVPTTATMDSAIQEALNGKVVYWIEHVTDEDILAKHERRTEICGFRRLKLCRCPHSIVATLQLYLLCRSTHSLHSDFVRFSAVQLAPGRTRVKWKTFFPLLPLN
jgi:hypothetical protein